MSLMSPTLHLPERVSIPIPEELRIVDLEKVRVLG